ncbi:MAG: hypothetical protein ACP5I1_16730, partial [Candidatus Hinthialibacter sp.]
LKQRLSLVSNQINEAENDGRKSAGDPQNPRNSLQEEIPFEMSQKACELSSLKQESEILNQQESHVESVISAISKQIEGEPKAKIEPEAHRKKKILVIPPTKNQPLPSPKSGGMYSRKNKK